MARLSLEILYQLVVSHVLTPEDFAPQQYQLQDGGVVTLPKPPGHVILEHMLNDSSLLKKVYIRWVPHPPTPPSPPPYPPHHFLLY